MLKKIFDFYLDASVHVALAVVSLYALAVLYLNIPLNRAYVFFLGCSTMVCYNFMKYGVEAEKYLIVKNTYQRYIQIFSFIMFGLGCYYFLQLPQLLYTPILFLTVLSTLYGIPFLPSAKNLRSLGGLKIFLVALVWVGFIVWVPFVENSLKFDGSIALLMIQFFVLVLILFIPFEIRDLSYDSADLRTLPQRYGIKKTKIIGYVLCALFLLLAIGWTKTIEHVLFWLVCTSLLVLVLARTKKNQKKYFSAFWVEGVPVVMVLLFYVIKLFWN